jgi:DNA-3-methyladenine glycosylase
VRARPLALRFFARDPLDVAPDLLNKLLAHDRRVGRIVEVEAYRGTDDPASHAYRGPTPRNEVMFGPAGRLYVYRSYGIHWCANVVCGTDGVAGAVLVRAVEPVRGLPAMRGDRPKATRDADLGAGPGKLCAALGIGGEHDGVDLRRGPVRVLDDGVSPPERPAHGTRVGITRAVDRPWRFGVPDSPALSRRFAGATA